jgi:threonylcarbamoyladenosine tRNA methylthiotransferase MtaB
LKKFSVCTLGCKVNAYDSEAMRTLFLNSGYEEVDFEQPADIAVINTCTVTAVADKKSRAMIRRAARTAKVIVAGCLAQKSAAELLAMEGVDAVVGTDGRVRIVEIAQMLLSDEKKIDATKDLKGCGYEALHIGGAGARTRGVIKIQEGCDNFCSYCIIPYVRGRSRSRALADIIAEAETMARGGVKELVLTGIHIASYEDGGRDLADVVLALDKLGIRIRLGSLEPGKFSKDFIKRIASANNLCPHFHISLQSGSNSVLKRMNRHYTAKEYLEFLRMLRSYFELPGITTDVIAGFPGETEDEHRETIEFVRACGFSRLHVFPFSARKGTKAYDMTPKVDKATARRRAAELISLGDELEAAYIGSLLGCSEEVLFEEASVAYPGCMEGYSSRYVRVAAIAAHNEVKKVALVRAKYKVIYGEEN